MSAATPAWIVEAANCVGHALHADRVLLFGSFAAGTATRHSDVDLFVIARTDLAPLQRIGAALAALPRDLPRAVDVIVYTPAEVAHVQSNFVERVLRTGKVIYECGQTA